MTSETRTTESLKAEYEAMLTNPAHKVKSGRSKGHWKLKSLRKLDGMDAELSKRGVIRLEGEWLSLRTDGSSYSAAA